MDNKTKIFLFSPFALAIILAVAANYIPVDMGPSGIGNRISMFSPSGLTLKEKQRVYVSPDLISPMDFNYSPPVEVSLPENKEEKAVLHEDNNDRTLSLIVISGEGRTAIIDGMPVKEGDKIADMKIVKIEHDRVLLKDKTLKWMYLE
ncbi:MAG: hypothetical protein HZC49_01785 [Nitrospirae bacterium]|nr:hypothetical protein [Nitrospirota bacterium]